MFLVVILGRRSSPEPTSVISAIAVDIDTLLQRQVRRESVIPHDERIPRARRR